MFIHISFHLFFIDLNIYSGTFPLGHLYSGDINLVPEKRPHNLYVTSLLKKTPLFRGKEHSFWVPKPTFNLHFRELLALKKWLAPWNVDNFQWAGDNDDSFQIINYLT